MPINVRSPTNAEVDSWWNFAFKFQKGNNSAFKNGIAGNFENVANPKQPGNLYCLTCTASVGGNDSQVRPVKKSSIAGRDVFVPIFLSVELNPSDADGDHGNNQNIIFEIEDNSGNVEKPSTFKVNRSGVTINNVPQQDEFELSQQGTVNVHTRNICAVIPNNQLSNIKRITFGGSGGRISPQNPQQFTTKVTYQII